MPPGAGRNVIVLGAAGREANAVDRQRIEASITAARALNSRAEIVSMALDALPDAPGCERLCSA